MPIKPIYTKREDAPESLRDELVEEKSGDTTYFRLDVEAMDGWELSNTKGLISSLEKERRVNRSVKQALTAYTNADDSYDIAALGSDLEELAKLREYKPDEAHKAEHAKLSNQRDAAHRSAARLFAENHLLRAMPGVNARKSLVKVLLSDGKEGGMAGIVHKDGSYGYRFYSADGDEVLGEDGKPITAAAQLKAMSEDLDHEHADLFIREHAPGSGQGGRESGGGGGGSGDETLDAAWEKGDMAAVDKALGLD